MIRYLFFDWFLGSQQSSTTCSIILYLYVETCQARKLVLVIRFELMTLTMSPWYSTDWAKRVWEYQLLKTKDFTWFPPLCTSVPLEGSSISPSVYLWFGISRCSKQRMFLVRLNYRPSIGQNGARTQNLHFYFIYPSWWKWWAMLESNQRKSRGFNAVLFQTELMTQKIAKGFHVRHSNCNWSFP